MIGTGGWARYAVWEHSTTVRDLYARRCRREEPEMTCAAQAVELLAPFIRPGELVLDAGCGAGSLYHSFRDRDIDCRYVGIDASATLIGIGRRELPAHGLPPEHLLHLRIEDLEGSADHVVCMNVLTNIDGYHRPLERLLHVARGTLVLRESLRPGPSEYRYVRDAYLDPGADLRVHVNAYDIDAVTGFIEAEGFRVERVTDRRTGGVPEDVIAYPHHWTFLVARRVDA